MLRRYPYILLFCIALLSTLGVYGQMAMPDNVCVGQTKRYHVDPNPVPGSTYTWRIDGIVQAGFTTNEFDHTWNTAGTYTLDVQELSADRCLGPVRSGQVFVNPLPTAPTVGTITQPTCSVVTGSVILNGLPAGNWTINPGNIAGTGTTYTISALAPATYNFTVTNADGCISAASANVVIDAQPATPAAPAASVTQPTCAVNTGTITISAPLGADLEYSIDGTTFQALPSFTGLAQGTYTVSVRSTTDITCAASTPGLTVNAVPGAPAAPTASVTAQPTCTISTGTITVTAPANGAGISYTVTGTNPVVAALTNTTGIFSGLNPGIYDVTTTYNGCESPATTLTVNAAPGAPAAPTVGAIIQPTCALPTGSVILSGLPAGSWTINPGGIAGNTVSTTISGLATGTYNFTVTNALGCTSPPSGDVIITQTAAMTISSQPLPQTDCYGNQVEFSVVIIGGVGAVTYQWQQRPPSGTFSDIPGSNSALLTIDNIGVSGQNIDGTEYRVVLTDACQTLTSNIALLRVNSITDLTPGGSPTICSGGSLIYAVTTQGTVAGYQWLIQNGTNWDPISDGGAYSGTSTSQLTISNATTAQSGSYRVSVTFATLNQPSGFATCIVTSSTMLRDLVVREPITPPQIFASQSICYNTIPAALTSTSASGGSGPPYNYQWQSSPDGSSWVNIPDENSLSYSPPSFTATTSYRILANDAGTPWCGIGYSAVVVVTVNTSANTITLSSATGTDNQTLCTNSAITNITYATTSATGANVTGLPAGVTGSWAANVVTISGTPTVSGTFNYTVTLTGGCGTVTATGTITVNNPPAAPIATVTAQPTCAVPTGTITVTAPSPGAGISYTVTGTAPVVAPVTNATGIFAGLTPGVYDVTTTNNTCVSLPTALIVNAVPTAPPAPTASVTAQPTCGTPTGTIVITAPIGAYQYSIDGTNYQTGTTFSNLLPGPYNVTARPNADPACVSPQTPLTVNAVPSAPPAPTVGAIIHPTCVEPTGSVMLIGLPVGNWTINPGTLAGNTLSTTITGLTSGTTYNYTVTNADGCISAASADVVINEAECASLTVTKTVDQPNISAPATLNYTITVTNTGSVGLTGVTVSDPFTGGAAYSSGDTDGDNILDLTEAWIYTASYVVTQAMIDAGNNLVNTVSVTSTQVTTPVTAQATTTISTSASLSVTKTVDQPNISAPATLNYTITVTNTGTVGLTGVSVSDPFAGGAAYSSGDTDGDNVLDLTEAWIYTASYVVTQAMIDAGNNLVNTVGVTSTQVTNPVSAQAITTISGTSSLNVTKNQTGGPNPVTAAGQVITYRIVVTNTGSTSITGVALTESYPRAGAGTLSAPTESISTNGILNAGETWTYTATYTVTQADINAGNNLVNTVRVVTNQVPGPSIARATTPVTATASVTAVKSTTATSFTSIGEVINYTITITNSGNMTLTGVVANDPNAVVTCSNAPYILSPGARVTCTAVHTVSAADIAAGIIRNTANVTGYDPNMRTVTGTSNTVTVRLNNLPPTINCPDNINASTSSTTNNVLINTGLESVYSDPNNNIVSLTWVMTGATRAQSPASGINNLTSYTFNQGVSTVTYTVTDALGLSDNCSFTVTVIDITPPVALCRNIEVLLVLNTGLVTITEEDVDNDSYDNSGHIASMRVDVSDFDCSDLGPNNVTLTVYDESGNSASCVSVVTVSYAVVPNPVVTPVPDIICSGERTSLTLTNNIPNTSWSWTVDSPREISGASDDNTGTASSIKPILNNSGRNAHNVVYNITPRVYGQCDLAPITADVWVNPTPEILVNPEKAVICYGGSTVISLTNPNVSVRGQWMYDMTVTADPGINGHTTGGTALSALDLTETLTNSDRVDRKVVYRFTPRIVPEDGGADCMGTEETVTIWVRPSLKHFYTKELSDYNGFNISCYGQSNGFIKITPTEDASPMTFGWSNPYGYTATGQNISRLSAGQYIVLVTDDNMCTEAETIELIEPEQLGITIVPSVSMDGGYNINCAGAQTGFATASAVNNVGAVAYMWADGFLENARTNLSAGTYKLIIIDSNNCRAESTVTLTEPDPIRLAFDITKAFCPDKPDGEIRLTVTGGVSVSDYICLWSNNATTRNISGLLDGVYRVIVADHNGCSVTGNVKLDYMNEICLIIPDAISPNGDLINDVWNIVNIELYPRVEVKVFNRWGQILWQAEDGYPHPWDGRGNNEILPIDSYHYSIDLHNRTKPIIGVVTIVR